MPKIIVKLRGDEQVEVHVKSVRQAEIQAKIMVTQGVRIVEDLKDGYGGKRIIYKPAHQVLSVEFDIK